MQDCSFWNPVQRQSIPDLNISFRPRLDLVTYLQSFGLKNIAFFSIGVKNERDSRTPIRIVFDRNHLAGNSKLLPFEIDGSKCPLMSTALMPHNEKSPIIASALFAHAVRQTFLGRL